MTAVILKPMKTAISVPDDLYRRAEEYAARTGLSRSGVFAAALRRYLDEAEAEDVTARLDAVHGARKVTLDPVLAAMQLGSLEREDW